MDAKGDINLLSAEPNRKYSLFARGSYSTQAHLCEPLLAHGYTDSLALSTMCSSSTNKGFSERMNQIHQRHISYSDGNTEQTWADGDLSRSLVDFKSYVS